MYLSRRCSLPRKEKPVAIAEIEAAGLPYSTVVKIGDRYYFSGVIAINKDKKPIGDLPDQINGILSRMVYLLTLCDLNVSDVYGATIMLAKNMDGYDLVNESWEGLFKNSSIKPRRKVFAVAALPFGCDIEIEFEAIRQSDD